MDVQALILTGFGINCDHETEDAFRRAGASTHCIHLNDLIQDPGTFDDAHILAIPGGFSFGDDVASGRILANRVRYKLGPELQRFVAEGKLIIGICNGFQVMVKMGLLPLFENDFTQEVTLTHNDSNRFENRWVHLAVEPTTRCVWLQGMESLDAPVRHGEGKFVARDSAVLDRMRAQGQIALRYVGAEGTSADGEFPINPNGSVDDIAGICDPTGRVFGLMPHPEAYLDATNHPLWTRNGMSGEGAGVALFRNGVNFARENLLTGRLSPTTP